VKNLTQNSTKIRVMFFRLDEREAPIVTAIKRFVKCYKTLDKDNPTHPQDAL
jgi:hypothetical protein